MAEKKQKKKKEKKKPKPAKRSGPLPFEEAYENGNFYLARNLAQAALDGSEESQARDLLHRIRVDRGAVVVFAVCLVVYVLIASIGLGS